MDILAYILSLIAVVLSVIAVVVSVKSHQRQDHKIKIALRGLDRNIPDIVKAGSLRRG